MDIPVKTLRSGFSLPVYGLGTWGMGGGWEADSTNDEKEVAAIKGAIDRGITHIDTAEIYGQGHAEELIGQAIKGCDRSKLIITSKVFGSNQRYDDLLRSFEASLKRLDTDYMDLYLLHRYPDKGIDIKDTMRAIDRLIDEGALKNVGACNLSINRLKDVQAHTTNQIVCNQIHYSLQMREAEKAGVIQYCQENDVLITAWGPLEKGALESADILHAMADKYGKTPYQIALNWLITQPNVITIPKTTSLEHLDENLGSLGWNLSDEDMAELTKNFPDQQFHSHRVPLDYEANIAP